MPSESVDLVGPTSETVRSCSKLTRGYYDFLNRVDPLDRWEHLRVLEEPIHTDRENPDLIEQERVLQMYFPSLVHHAFTARDYGAMARRLGFRYAWSRLFMHAPVLEVLNKFFSHKKPHLIFEPGCFCSGLMHYLPSQWGSQYMGMDVSPVAMDVCRALANEHGVGDKLSLFSGNFLQLTPERFEQITGQPVKGSVILLSNFFQAAANDWNLFPCLELGDCWPAYALLVSYWVQAGAIVLLCERNEDPQGIAESLQFFSRPIAPRLESKVMTEFQTYCTTDMTVENLLGEWQQADASVVVAFDSSTSG